MTITHRAPDTLRAHPLNARLYEAGRDDADLRRSVAEEGIIVPLIIDQHDTILSGHRRWCVARLLGLDTVPVVVREVASPLERVMHCGVYGQQLGFPKAHGAPCEDSGTRRAGVGGCLRQG